MKDVFDILADPAWNSVPSADAHALSTSDDLSQPVRMPPPHVLVAADMHPMSLQMLAQQIGNSEQH